MENNNPTRTRREAAVLVFVVFLLGLLVGAFGNHLWGERVWGHSVAEHHAGHPGPPSTARIVNDFTRELQLTPDQQKQLGSIIDETRTQWATQHEQIRQQGRERIRAILTPEQLPKFDAFMHHIDEQHKRERAHAQSQH
jgi:Spy/CpxP family protein refolding chaperone